MAVTVEVKPRRYHLNQRFQPNQTGRVEPLPGSSNEPFKLNEAQKIQLLLFIIITQKCRETLIFSSAAAITAAAADTEPFSFPVVLPSMANKSSSKNREERAENAVAEAVEKPSSAKKKRGDEIDEIFATKKKNKTAEKEDKQKKKSKDLSAKPMKMKRQKKKDDTEGRFSLSEPSSKSRRKTGDGFTIYTEEELGLTNADAGGTGQCPFDCSCCF